MECRRWRSALVSGRDTGEFQREDMHSREENRKTKFNEQNERNRGQYRQAKAQNNTQV